MSQDLNQSEQGNGAATGPMLTPATPAEYRGLTPDELKQIDVLLGRTGPTLIRRPEPVPEPPTSTSRLLQTVLVAIILLSIVAAAMYLFR